MSEKLTVNLRQNSAGFEGSVQIPGLKSTKLARKDGTTTFPSSSAVKTVARSVGTRLGMEVSYVEPQQKRLAAKKVAAKNPTKVKATKNSQSTASGQTCQKN